MTENKERLDKDELIKSLTELEFSPEEIDSIVEKAEKEGGFKDKVEDVAEEKDENEKTVDEEAADKNEMKKAYDKVMSMKDELDKSMADFLNKFGSAPGILTPATDLSVESTVKAVAKAEVDGFEKSFTGKFDSIEKSFGDFVLDQSKVNDELVKSISKISETVNAIAETPNPFKGIFHNYKNSILEKGEKTNDNGHKVVSLRNKELTTETFEKAVDKVTNEEDKQIIRNMISDFTIAGKLNPTGLDIVSKALEIDFEK